MKPLAESELVEVQGQARFRIDRPKAAQASFEVNGHVRVNRCPFANGRRHWHPLGGGRAAPELILPECRQPLLRDLDPKTANRSIGKQVVTGRCLGRGRR